MNPTVAARPAPAKSSLALGPTRAPDDIDRFLELDRVRSFTLPFDMSRLACVTRPNMCGTARAAQFLLATLERRLEIMQSETSTDPKRHEQLAAIRYYLDRIRAAGLAVGATFASGGLTESVASRGAEEFCQAES